MKQTAVEWLSIEIGKCLEKYDGFSLVIKIDEIINQAKEMEKQQQGYSEEEVEVLIKTTYEETMRAMVDWFVNNKDKNQEEIESAIKNYVYPRLAEKGINFKKK